VNTTDLDQLKLSKLLRESEQRKADLIRLQGELLKMKKLTEDALKKRESEVEILAQIAVDAQYRAANLQRAIRDLLEVVAAVTREMSDVSGAAGHQAIPTRLGSWRMILSAAMEECEVRTK
jgi:hypothetical protein